MKKKYVIDPVTPGFTSINLKCETTTQIFFFNCILDGSFSLNPLIVKNYQQWFIDNWLKGISIW